MCSQRTAPLTHLMDRLTEASRGQHVSVSDVLDKLGRRGIVPFILVVALLTASPLSGIPGVPTFAAFLIITLALQALLGRRRVWLPKRVLKLQVASDRLQTAVSWLRRPSAFVERYSRHRLSVLTNGVMRGVALLVCAIVALFWPPLEFLPFMSTFGAGIVCLLAFGLMTRDGLYVLTGYCVLGLCIFMVFLVF